MTDKLRDENTAAFIASLQANPFDPMTRAVFADYLEEHGNGESDLERAELLRKGLIPLTGFDYMAARFLAGCNFAPATWDKRFVLGLSERANERPIALTPKQYLWMWVLLWRYRKSVRVERVRAEAEKRYNAYIELLGLQHLKPADRRRKPKMNDATTLFDETPLPQ